jgi:hypothetical protein
VATGLLLALKSLYHPQELEPEVFDWAAVTLVHGGANGLDSIAETFAKSWGMTVEKHAAEWHHYGRRAGHVRNVRMVNEGANVCVAFPLGESVGTRDAMRLAAAARIPVLNLGDTAEEDALFL